MRIINYDDDDDDDDNDDDGDGDDDDPDDSPPTLSRNSLPTPTAFKDMTML